MSMSMHLVVVGTATVRQRSFATHFQKTRAFTAVRQTRQRSVFRWLIALARKTMVLLIVCLCRSTTWPAIGTSSSKSSREPKTLGYVMHAIQDACITTTVRAAPAIGTVSMKRNWQNTSIPGSGISAFGKMSLSLLYQWNNIDENNPTSLIIADFVKIPHRNWRIDLLVTWMALQAYRAYSVIYKGFKSCVDSQYPQLCGNLRRKLLLFAC